MRDLSISSMILICRSFLESHRALLENKPLLALLIPELEELSKRLAQSRYEASPSPHPTAVFRQNLQGLDDRHDINNRLVFTLLELAALVAQTSSSKEAFSEAKATLYPKKLAINRASYEVEAGEAIRVGGLLSKSPELKDLLARVRLTVEGTEYRADKILRDLEKIGHEMLSNIQSIHSVQSEAASRSVPTPAASNAERQARLRFFALFKVLEANANLAYGADSEAYETLFFTYNEEIRKQKDRAKAQSNAEPLPSPAPQDPNASENAPTPDPLVKPLTTTPQS